MPRKYCNQVRIYIVKWRKKKVKEWKANGYCVRCGYDKENDIFTRCFTCRVYIARLKRQFRKRKHELCQRSH